MVEQTINAAFFFLVFISCIRHLGVVVRLAYQTDRGSRHKLTVEHVHTHPGPDILR